MTIDQIDAAIKSETTWRYMALAGDLSEECDHLGSWSEACPCHSNFSQQSQEFLREAEAAKRKKRRVQPRGFMATESCPFKGCRAYELAAGQAMESQREKMNANRLKVLAHVATAAESEKHVLVADWELARSRLYSHLASFTPSKLQTGYTVTSDKGQ